MTQKLRKVLVIEDYENQMLGYRLLFKKAEIELIEAKTLVDAKRAFQEHPDVAAIFVDGLFPNEAGQPVRPEQGDPCNGEMFVRWLKSRYTRYSGPIIACSSATKYNDLMVARGATHRCEKGEPICALAQELLNDATS